MKPFAWFWSQAREDADVAEEAAETEEADRRELELGIPREQWPKGVEGSLNKGLVADDGSGAASPESFCAASAASQQPAAAYPPTSPGKGRRASSTYAVELTKTPMGFGITLTADGTVTEIKRGSQAARSGRIKLGDRLAAVNGEAPTKATPPTSLLAQQGLHGSTVKLELIPDADADPDPAIQAAATAAAALAAAELAAAAAPAPTGGAAVKADADPYDPYESEVAAEKLKSEDPYESEVNEESGPTSKSASQDATPLSNPNPNPNPKPKPDRNPNPDPDPNPGNPNPSPRRTSPPAARARRTMTRRRWCGASRGSSTTSPREILTRRASSRTRTLTRSPNPKP